MTEFDESAFDDSLDDLFSDLDRNADDQAQRQPFKFLDAYTTDDRDLFFGRDLELRELYSRFFNSRLTVVFGLSGSGKTSLVQCGLVSEIAVTEATFFTVRTAVDPFNSLKDEVARRVDLPEDMTDHVEILREASYQLSKTLVIFLDQFEEIFIMQSLSARKNFIAELKRWLETGIDLRVIINIREEYLARLSEFEAVIPDFLANRFWVRKMSQEQAEEAIIKPCEVCGVEVERAVATQLLEDLTGEDGTIELPYMQVIMDTLYRQAIERDPDQPVISMANYEGQGGVGNILASFIEGRLSEFSDPDLGRQLLKAMISADGTKLVIGLEELGERAANFGDAIAPGTLLDTVNQLIDNRIVREDPSTHFYELRHDTLALQVHNWMTGIEKELVEIRQLIDSRFDEYQSRGSLLDASTLKELQVYEDRLVLSPEKKAFIDASWVETELSRRSRMRLIIGAAASIIIVLSGFTTWALFASADARDAQRVAEQEKGRAEGALKSAQLEKARAEQAQQVAETERSKAEAALITAEEQRQLAQSEKEKAIAEEEKAQRNRREAIEQSRQAEEARGQAQQERVRALEQAEIARAGQLAALSLLRSAGDPVLGFRLAEASYQLRPTDLAQQALFKAYETDAFHSIMHRHRLAGSNTGMIAAEFSPDGRYLAVAPGDQSIKIWNFANGALHLELHSPSALIHAFAFSPDSRFLLTGAADGTADIWQLEDGTSVAALQGHREQIETAHFSANGEYVVTTSLDGDTRIWNLAEPGSGMVVTGHSGRPVKSSLSADSRYLVIPSRDHAADIWELTNGQRVQELVGHESWVSQAVFSPNAQRVATASWDGTVRLWASTEGRLLRQFIGHRAGVSSVHFSDSGRLLITASKDSTARIWHSQTGELIQTLSGHSGFVVEAMISPDEHYAITASVDQTTRIWNIESGRQLQALEWTGNGNTPAIFSPDGRYIVTGSTEGAALVWPATAEEILNLVNSTQGRDLIRNLTPAEKALYGI
jgi:WD40 repeat protein